MNETTKHTPGPWRWTGRYGQNNLLGAYGQLVMFGANGGLSFEADSALIAAAPEMLEALKRMICHAVYNTEYNKWTIEMSDFVLQHNKQLIAKAEGRQP